MMSEAIKNNKDKSIIEDIMFRNNDLHHVPIRHVISVLEALRKAGHLNYSNEE